MKKPLLLFLSLCISIMMQAQVSKTINVTTAGSLSSLLTATEKTNVTNLTVTGTIDSLDFVTMKWMTTLKVLDLSGANCSAIPPSAFYVCSGLTSVTIPSSVTAIGDKAFQYCSSLTSVSIPSSVIAIGDYAFENCSGLITVDANNLNYSSTSGVLFNKTQTLIIQCPTILTGSYTIPSTVTAFGNGAFASCIGLTSVSIPSLITVIGDEAFQNCPGLTSVSIPSSVTAIGRSAFASCSGLTSVSIPSSVTAIGESAFADCSGLTSVSIPSSVTSIGDNAFDGCKGLTSVNIPSSVTAIKGGVFENCSGLKSVIIPSSVTSIGWSAFYYCSGLTSIIIPSSVTSIGDEAFYGCSGLTSIYTNSGTPISLDYHGVFGDNIKTTCVLYVPVNSKSAYQAAIEWKDFTNIVEFTPTGFETRIIDKLVLFPNPTTSNFTVNTEGNAIIQVYSITGELVLHTKILGKESISTNNLQTGMYVVKIITSDMITTRNLIVE